MSFADYVLGKSIALVGPAPLTRDVTAAVDDHDLVYRIGFHDKFPPGTGSRADIAFFNGEQGRVTEDDEDSWQLQAVIDADWWVGKNRVPWRSHAKNARKAVRTPIANPNAATHALYDLMQFDVDVITVYGVDLYSGGPTAFYNETYTGVDWVPLERHAQAFITHRPWEQMRLHRAVYQTGKVIGDERYAAAVTMTDEEYQAVIDEWEALVPTVEVAK